MYQDHAVLNPEAFWYALVSGKANPSPTPLLQLLFTLGFSLIILLIFCMIFRILLPGFFFKVTLFGLIYNLRRIDRFKLYGIFLSVNMVQISICSRVFFI